MDNQQLRSLTKRKLKDLKRKDQGKLRRNFNIPRFRLEKNLHLRRLMAELRRAPPQNSVGNAPLPNPSSLRIPMKRHAQLFRSVHCTEKREVFVFEKLGEMSVT